MRVDIARSMLEACKQRARELRSPVSIAIVDAGGHLVLFERMMSPYGWATSNISIAKATTAVMFNQPTDAVAQWGAGIPGFASSMATMTEGKFIMAAGGWPVQLGGATIGGIGVSGGNAPGRDDDIARAGLAAISAWVPSAPTSPAAGTQPPAGTQAAGSSSAPEPSPPALPGKDQRERQQDFSSAPTQPSTQHLSPASLDNPYANDSYNQYDADRSGGHNYEPGT